jgi:hypothetical protein
MRRAMIASTCLLSALMLAITLGVPLDARADPLNADPSAGDELNVPWPTLGLPDEITLVGANDNQDFRLPVQPGFGVRRLRGLIHAPVDFGAGFVEIDDANGTLLATVDLPAVIPSQAVVPFDVDVSTAQVTGSTLGLSFTVREGRIPPDQRCGLGERVVISDLAAVMTGIEPAPTTVASFFPPVLERLTIYTPIDANAAEQQAVLTLSSAVARVYRPQPTAISVVRQPRGAAPQPATQFSRAVVVEDGDAGIDVVNPGRPNVYLKLSGRGDQLTDQVSPVVNGLQSLVQIPDARVDKAGVTDSPASDEMSFDRLGLKGSSTVLRASTLTVGVDRAALGQARVDGLKVHLLASHTPIASLDSATLVVKVNGQAVYTTPLSDSGRVDAVFDVPGSFLGQRINLDFALTFSPRQLCNPTIAPMTFQLDPRSTVTVHRGGGAPGGFGAVPSEFSPEFLVAFDGSGPNLLDYATRVVADIARLTGTPLTPRVVDVMSAADSHTPALIVANAATLKMTSLRPPIGGESTDVTVGIADELRADIAGGLGSIQVFADQPRDRTVVLVTTSGVWSLVEPVLGYVEQLPDGWSSLVGNVAAAGPAGTVSNLSIGPVDAATPRPPDERNWTPWIATGAALVALAAVGLGMLLSSRRRS